MMKKNLHRTALLLSIGLPYGMHAGEIPDKPNILIFIADDLGWEEVGAYGHPVVRTPNIDSLALNGLRFDNFFLTASSSSPSRASIFTGILSACRCARQRKNDADALHLWFYTSDEGKDHCQWG